MYPMKFVINVQCTAVSLRAVPCLYER